MTEQFVIIGAGLAGAKAAETLRAEGFTGPIALVGSEAERPYERPPLSKGFLLGKQPRDKAFVHPEGWYAENDVTLISGATAVGLDVLPGHEALVALRMRAHAARRDDAGVRREFASYERAVLADAWAGGEPSPELRALRDELVGRAARPGALERPFARSERYELAVAGE